jgi:UDP-2-acetamido-2,6-beta-L-arabino-hexul-4-ose reductase
VNIVLTGGNGFLGWHTRVLAHSLGYQTASIGLGERYDGGSAAAAVSTADVVLHIAGVNRGSDEEVAEGNSTFARQLVEAVDAAASKPRQLVYANSIQAGNGSVYGTAKEEAGRFLAAAARDRGIEFINVLLPNLFGEHGVPQYNSVIATFCHRLAHGEALSVDSDKELTLLHAQQAAELLLGVRPVQDLESVTTTRTVTQIAEQLTEISRTYADGTIPEISSGFDRDLFNTYRSFLVGPALPISLERKSDSRGSFFEVIRSQGGQGQSSFSTTVPGITRGQHYHRRKIERFTVLAGTGEIAMRRMFSDEVLRFTVSGDQPVAIDMPTMWSHNITNTGSDMLYTMFWISEIFDPAAPDTIPEDV